MAKSGGSVIICLKNDQVKKAKLKVPKLNVIANFILFQAAWFACVIGAVQGLPWLAFAFVLVVVIGQWHFAKWSNNALIFILVAGILGGLVDQGFLQFNIVQYVAHGWTANMVPIWIIGLWLAFASTINLSMRWLRGKWLTQLLFGAIGGPMAYFAAQKLGAVVISSNPTDWAVLALAWAVMTVLLFKLAEYLEHVAVGGDANG